MNEGLIEFGEKAVEMALRDGADQAEAYVSAIEILTVNIENGAMRFSGWDSHKGMGVRVVKDQKTGFTYTTGMNRESIGDGVRVALKTASVKRPDVDFKSLPEPRTPSEVEGIFDDDVENLTVEEAKDIASRITDSAGSYREGIIPTFGVFESRVHEYAVVNSQGIEVGDAGTVVIAGLRTLLKDEGEITNGLAFQNSRFIKAIDPEDIGVRSAELATTSLNPRRVETMETTVVLDPDAVAGLFGGVLVPALYASNVQEKGSFLVDRLGSSVASDDVTITDDGTLKYGPRTYSVDSEGVPTRRKVLVDEGILKGYLYDTYSANKEGVESTGNAVRSGGFGPFSDPRGREYRFAPTIGGTNFVLEEGDVSREELIEGIDDGVLITFAVGGGSPTSGEFSADGRNLYRIEGGEVTYPIRQAIFAGNIMDLLMGVDGIADNPRSSRGLGPGEIIVPSLRVRKGLIIGDK